MDNIISNLITAIISLLGGFWVGIYTVKKTNIEKARTNFKVAFIDEIIFIADNISSQNSDPPYNPPINYTDTLLKARSKHRKAIEVFRQYISSEKYNKINNAYENYYNPRQEKGTPETINILSFGLYNMSKNEINNIIGREIYGLELALENIKEIVELA